MIGMIPIQENEIAPFKPLRWHVPAWRDKSLVMLLSGGSGGGKSELASQKMHGYLLKYPGAIGLAVRKTQSATNQSCVPTLWRVMGGEESGILWNNRITYSIIRMVLCCIRAA